MELYKLNEMVVDFFQHDIKNRVVPVGVTLSRFVWD